MSKPRARKPRFRRTSPTPPIHLTERDFQILNEVSIHRFLRSDHLTSLIKGSRQHVTRRLGRLYHTGYLERPSHQRQLQDAAGHICYSLSERGRKELIRIGTAVYPGVPRIRKLSSGLHLGHDLRVSDIMVCLNSMADSQKYQLHHHHQWLSFKQKPEEESCLHAMKWKLRSQRARDKIFKWVIPDAAFSFVLPDEREIYFLLEVDRGTMPVRRSKPGQSSFVGKVEAYRETRNVGQLWKLWRIPGFRILVVTETEARRKSLQSATAQCFRNGRSTMFLFAVAATLICDANDGRGTWEDCSGKPVELISSSSTKLNMRQDHSQDPLW